MIMLRLMIMTMLIIIIIITLFTKIFTQYTRHGIYTHGRRTHTHLAQ